MNKMHTDDIKARVKRFICNTIDLYRYHIRQDTERYSKNVCQQQLLQH